MNKQIEEIKSVLVRTHKRARTGQEDYMQDRYAKALYNEGYRKQSKGEWMSKLVRARTPFARNYYCSICKHEPIELNDFCPNCGAYMKDESEGAE